MSFERPLQGGCQCGRNRYVVEFPKEPSANESIQVIFDAGHSHRIAQASPFPAFVRVPLEWYHSATIAFYPDETSSMIHKVYTAPHEEHSKRHFCGFCGTTLTYWSEEPHSEADFIRLTLASLSSADLHDLEDLGLLPDEDDEVDDAPQTPREEANMTGTDGEVVIHAGRETLGGLPWLDSLVAGSRLGTLRASTGKSQSHDGRVKVEWEVVEWTEGEGGGEVGGDVTRLGKRKLAEREETNEAEAMEDIRH